MHKLCPRASNPSSRRDFLKAGLAAAALPGLGKAFDVPAGQRTATDWVTLGRSGVKVTRLAFGTGTYSGKVQRELGQAEFTRLVRYAYDRGIRFFETADSYGGMPEMLATALQGLPRDSYRLMTKFNTHDIDTARPTIDRFRKEMNSEYFDVLLMHCVRKPTWPEDLKKLEDEFSEAKQKKIVLAHGASVHGLQALERFPGNDWLDIAMIRMNHKGVKMDTNELRDTDDLGDVNQVVSHMKKVHAQGAGVISMKLVGEGQFSNREDRQKALKFAMSLGAIDAVTIGFKNTAEINEAIENLNGALA
jgi:predicted aldo/keto reductase-like oxidoreductase